MSLLAVAGANSASGSYVVDNSLKFESDNSEYLERTQGTPARKNKKRQRKSKEATEMPIYMIL